jgi:hypothetical protein
MHERLLGGGGRGPSVVGFRGRRRGAPGQPQQAKQDDQVEGIRPVPWRHDFLPSATGRMAHERAGAWSLLLPCAHPPPASLMARTTSTGTQMRRAVGSAGMISLSKQLAQTLAWSGGHPEDLGRLTDQASPSPPGELQRRIDSGKSTPSVADSDGDACVDGTLFSAIFARRSCLPFKTLPRAAPLRSR